MSRRSSDIVDNENNYVVLPLPDKQLITAVNQNSLHSINDIEFSLFNLNLACKKLMIRAIIIEDEPAAQDVLNSLINTYLRSKVEISGSYSTIEDATEAIMNDDKIQLIFLDIQLGEGRSGFELFHFLDFKKHSVIFTTAFEKQAIRAFRLNAVDFLLKPVNYTELISAVNKTIDTINVKQNTTCLKDIFNELKTSQAELTFNKLVVLNNETYEFVHFSEILYLQGDGNYTRIFCKNGKEFLTPKTLKLYEEMLPKELFFRVHKSFLVNLNHILNYTKSNGNFVTLINQIEIPVSQRKTEEFMRTIRSFHSHFYK